MLLVSVTVQRLHIVGILTSVSPPSVAKVKEEQKNMKRIFYEPETNK